MAEPQRTFVSAADDRFDRKRIDFFNVTDAAFIYTAAEDVREQLRTIMYQNVQGVRSIRREIWSTLNIQEVNLPGEILGEATLLAESGIAPWYSARNSPISKALYPGSGLADGPMASAATYSMKLLRD
jgi:hypothetical protein